MCQVSAFVKDGEKEELLRENVTNMEMLVQGVRLSTLFDGPEEYEELSLHHVDFSAGRIVFEKNAEEKEESA
tara:strand:+ start:307 stop:522 length:216 start_codon:yes stop_codon:yes gene_type:complete